jgi:hypothetical protein
MPELQKSTEVKTMQRRFKLCFPIIHKQKLFMLADLLIPLWNANFNSFKMRFEPLS